MGRCLAKLLAAGAFLAVGLASSAATYNGVSYSESGNIEAGRWTSQFAKAKTCAYNNHVPLLVVWVNPGCGYCRNFEANVLSTSSVTSWLKKRGYIGVFAVNTVTSEAGAANSFIGSVSKYPKCTVYWNPPSGSPIKYSFTGRSMSATTYEDTIDAKVGEYAGVTKKFYALTLTASPSAGGTLSGGGTHEANKKVSLRATTEKGYVFLGWYDGSERLSEAKSFAFAMPTKDKKLTAKFATAAADAAAVTATLNGFAFSEKKTSLVTNVMCGVSVSWPLVSAGLTTTTVSVSGLPSGLKFSAKTGLITGVPSRAQQKSVKIVVKTAGGTKVAYVLDVNVQALPIWASGTFNGGGVDGLLTLTVGSSGKVSGKYLADGTNWTLAASSYANYDAKKDAFGAVVLAKSGKVVLTNRVTVTGNAETLVGLAQGPRFTGWWNGWKNAACKDAAKLIDHATNITYSVEFPVPGTVTLSFGSSGTVTAKGVFVVGRNARTGRDVTHSVSCSTSLCRQDKIENMVLYLYFPPKNGIFCGFVDCLELGFDGENIFFKNFVTRLSSPDITCIYSNG